MSIGYPVGYPPETDVTSLLPDIAVSPYFGPLVAPLQSLDDQVRSLYAGLADLSDAVGLTLDLAGDLVGEPRSGLRDDEYRRIIAGRRVARLGGVTPGRVAAGWVALTEPLEWRIEAPGSASVHLSARVAYVPADGWIVRASSVVRALLAVWVDAEAILYRSDTAIYDDPSTGYDIGTYAWSLRTQRPS